MTPEELDAALKEYEIASNNLGWHLACGVDDEYTDDARCRQREARAVILNYIKVLEEENAVLEEENACLFEVVFPRKHRKDIESWAKKQE